MGRKKKTEKEEKPKEEDKILEEEEEEGPKEEDKTSEEKEEEKPKETKIKGLISASSFGKFKRIKFIKLGTTYTEMVPSDADIGKFIKGFKK